MESNDRRRLAHSRGRRRDRRSRRRPSAPALIPHQRLCDHRGRLLADIDTTALWRDVRPCLALHRADLHEILASHGEPIPVRRGVSLQQLSQGDYTVTVEFGDGSARCRRRLAPGPGASPEQVVDLSVGQP